MKDKYFTYLFGIYVFAIVLDLLSTLGNWGLLQYLESNPIYKYVGLPGIVIINILIAGFWYYSYTHSTNPTWRYITTYSLVAVIITRMFVIRQNFLVMQDYHANAEVVIAAAKQVTQAAKDQYIYSMVAMNIVPLFNSIIAWMFFQGDHKIEVKNDN